MRTHFNDVAKVAKKNRRPAVIMHRSYCGFLSDFDSLRQNPSDFDSLKIQNGETMFNRCSYQRGCLGLSYTGLEAAMNLYRLREKQT